MTMKREQRMVEEAVAVEVRQESARPVIQGYAAVFNVKTNILGLFTESIRPGAFSRAIAEQQDVRALFNHSPDYVLGRTKNGTLVLREDIKGLWTEASPPDTQQARDVVENIRVGNVSGMSFAFQIVKQEWKFSEKKEELDHREITEVRLFDIGPVTFPAYEQTSVGVRGAMEDLHHEARKAWEEANRPEAPVLIKGIYPEVVLLRAAALRRKYGLAA